MPGVEDLQAAELHQLDVARSELDFESPTAVRRPEQDHLALQGVVPLAIGADLLGNVAGVVGVVADHKDQWLRSVSQARERRFCARFQKTKPLKLEGTSKPRSSRSRIVTCSCADVIAAAAALVSTDASMPRRPSQRA